MAGVGAVSVPLMYQDPNGYSVLTDLAAAADGNTGAIAGIPYHIQYGLVNGLPDIIALAALGAGLNWAGKKFGLRRATHVTRKWSLF